MKKGWYYNKWVNILLHLFGWAVIFSLPFLLRTTYNNSHQNHAPASDTGFQYFYIASSIFWVGIFYLNAFLLITHFLYTKSTGTQDAIQMGGQ